jgi:hypothetical protein
MKFFHIKTSSERKVIGPQYPQIQTSDGTVDAKAPDSYYNVYSNVFPVFIPNLNYLVLHKQAILTDVLSAAMIRPGFIVNEKVKNILSQHKLPPHKFYPATIEHKGVFYQNERIDIQQIENGSVGECRTNCNAHKWKKPRNSHVLRSADLIYYSMRNLSCKGSASPYLSNFVLK